MYLWAESEELPDLSLTALIGEALARHAAAGHIALLDGDDAVTYSNLAEAVAAMSGSLRVSGIGRGDITGLSFSGKRVGIVAFLAALRVGACPCLIDPRLPMATRTAHLTSAGARYLLTDESSLSRHQGGSSLRITRMDELADACPFIDDELGPDDRAMVQFTSGSTGMPKAALLSHRNLVCNAIGVMRHTGIGPQDRFLHVMPLFHTNGINNQVIAPLLAGASIALSDRFAAADAQDLIDRYRPTIMTGVPTTYSRILEHCGGQIRAGALRLLRCGSAPISAALHEEIEAAFGVPLAVSYGLSEATCTSTINPPSARRIGSVGTVLTHQTVALLEPGGTQPVGGGREGEVCIGGPSLMSGYLNAPGERPIVDGWLRTGDLGRFDEDGYLSLTGRIKDVIIRGGENLSPQMIEEVILADPSVAACCIVGRTHHDLGEVPVAFIVRVPGIPLEGEAVAQRVRTRLSRAHVPQDIWFVDELPENAVGKIDRKALRKLCEREPESAP
ncbi:class I adenylate-forming enzyme family protein [Pararhizobium haloflavum]|uniref:class I adenylate-forming enzyme family protein n=1 Tax=Pararhizobium haloflavum TaxID=2037914 RepID=UPI001FDF2100|nr:class I adenylate-forming enzyme family protein [Pararhizobium haloflavum]